MNFMFTHNIQIVHMSMYVYTSIYIDTILRKNILKRVILKGHL